MYIFYILYSISFQVGLTWQEQRSQKATAFGGLLGLSHIKETLSPIFSFSEDFYFQVVFYFFFLPSVILFWERRSRAPVDFEALHDTVIFVDIDLRSWTSTTLYNGISHWIKLVVYKFQIPVNNMHRNEHKQSDVAF